jgi:hypothetical protein
MLTRQEKYSKNSQKSRKFPETHWDMHNPNKVFGADEKDFRAL